MFRLGSALVIILAGAAGLIIGTLNSERVTLDLLWVQLHWPLGLLALLFFAAGILLGLLIAYLLQVLPLRLRLRREQRHSESGNRVEVSTTDD